jgi:hypothetical protein
MASKLHQWLMAVTSPNELLHLTFLRKGYAPMPRYHLSPIISGWTVRDHEGEEHPDLEAARTSAVLSAREMLADQLRGEDVSLQGFEIADENGQVLQVVDFSEILKGRI